MKDNPQDYICNKAETCKTPQCAHSIPHESIYGCEQATYCEDKLVRCVPVKREYVGYE